MQTLLKTTGAYKLLQNEGKNKDFSHAYLLLFEDARNLRVALKTFAKLFFYCENEYTEKERRISGLIDAENYADCLFFPDEEGKKLLEKIVERKLLSEDGLIIYEWDKPLQTQVEGLECYDERGYGKAYFTFFCKKQEG